MDETPLQTLVSAIGKEGDVAEPPKPEPTPVATTNQPETPKEPETPKGEKAGETGTPKAGEVKPEGEVETKPEGEKTGEKPKGEKEPEKPTEPIDWGSKEYLKNKQPENGELRYKEFYEDMGKALNLQPDSDRDIILKEVESLKSRAVSSDNIWANESLRQANEIAKNKGDWKGFLGYATMNVDSSSDEELIRLKMQENGNSEELINEYIEEHKDTPGLKKEASEIRQSLKYTREQRTKELADQAKASESQRNIQVQETNERLKKVINDATDINGFSLDDDAKARILDIATGTTTVNGNKVSKLFAHFLYNDEGNLDPQKTFNYIAKAEFFDGITDYLRKEGKTAGKRETMDKLQNVDLGTGPAAPKEGKPEELTGLGALNRAAEERGQKPLHVMHSR